LKPKPVKPKSGGALCGSGVLRIGPQPLACRWS